MVYSEIHHQEKGFWLVGFILFKYLGFYRGFFLIVKTDACFFGTYVMLNGFIVCFLLWMTVNAFFLRRIFLFCFVVVEWSIWTPIGYFWNWVCNTFLRYFFVFFEFNIFCVSYRCPTRHFKCFLFQILFCLINSAERINVSNIWPFESRKRVQRFVIKIQFSWTFKFMNNWNGHIF